MEVLNEGAQLIRRVSAREGDSRHEILRLIERHHSIVKEGDPDLVEPTVLGVVVDLLEGAGVRDLPLLRGID